jgi:Flp pilus assembly pilin Flp
MASFVLRLIRDETGQDLVEYALLTATIGFAGLAVFGVILDVISNTYGSQETAVNANWIPCPSPCASGGS